ncbi:hypothetical protein L2E82_41626 [Cichorium intybus]|uniref:Uncharacterized protein n=1 Tax=Cichorium intybus TaxID=13427 RepID=A0ACB9ANI5_CICIN|nr:hypothetical protein L2E82_41626 [Cichorium intybus]
MLVALQTRRATLKVHTNKLVAKAMLQSSLPKLCPKEEDLLIWSKVHLDLYFDYKNNTTNDFCTDGTTKDNNWSCCYCCAYHEVSPNSAPSFQEAGYNKICKSTTSTVVTSSTLSSSSGPIADKEKVAAQELSKAEKKKLQQDQWDFAV